MEVNNKSMIIENLTVFSLPFIFFYKLRGFDIYAYRISPFIQLKIGQKVIQMLKIKLQTSEGIQNHEYKIYQTVYEWGNALRNDIEAHSLIPQVIENNFQLNSPLAKKKFSLALLKHLFSMVTASADFYVQCNEVASKTGRAPKIFASSFPLLSVPFRSVYELYPNSYPRWAYMLNSMSGATKLLFQYIWKRLPKRYNFKKSTQPVEQAAEVSKDQKVIMFPYKGIFYGNMFLKDYFYGEGPLSPENIHHISVGDTEEELKKSIEYYKANNIPHSELNNLGHIPLSTILKKFFKIIFSLPKKKILAEVDRYGLLTSVILFYVILFMDRYLKGISHFKKAKLAIIGHDVLFSPWLALTLELKEIKTVAVQERLIHSMGQICNVMIDHYFVVGPGMIKHVERYAKDFHIEKSYVLGPVRLDDALEEMKNIKSDKYDEIKKNYFLLVAMPFHCVMTAEENRLAMGLHWKNLREFYTTLIAIAEKHPKVYIAIKLKQVTIVEVKEFKDIIQRIEELPNIEIEMNTDYYTPAKFLALSDAGIAMHTSMGDEMLALGKPTIFYDFFGCPSAFYDYENLPVVARTRSEVFSLLEKILNKTWATPQEIEMLQLKLYSGVPTGNFKKKLRNQTIQILQNLG